MPCLINIDAKKAERLCLTLRGHIHADDAIIDSLYLINPIYTIILDLKCQNYTREAPPLAAQT